MKKAALLSFLIFFFIPHFLTAQVQIKTGSIRVDIGKYGLIRLFSSEGTDTLKQIYRLNTLVGINKDMVFDYIQDAGIQDSLRTDTSKQYSDFLVYGTFNNSYSNQPPDILQKLFIYGWKNGSYILVKNRFINRQPEAVNAFIGVEHIPQPDGLYAQDTVRFIGDKKIIDTYRGGSHIGIKVLSQDITSLTSFNFYGNYPADSSYWKWLTYGMIDTFFAANDSGPVSISSVTPLFIGSGDSVDFYYAVSYGTDSAQMVANMDTAASRYMFITPVEEQYAAAPSEYLLYQNYPNPFNPATNITFTLPEKAHVKLNIYNIAGEQVDELLNTEMESGRHSVTFNAAGLSSGVYFYTLTAGNTRFVKKMTLIK